SLYERCPRRFLYTHILEVGGRRRETAFMKLHVAVQQVVDAIRQHGGSGASPEELRTAFEEAWGTEGPLEHGYCEEYKAIGWQLLRFYSECVGESELQPPQELRLAVDGGEIVVTPDQQLAGERGEIVMRRVNTGHKHSKDGENLAAAAFHLAATSHRPGCRVELVHLSDEKVTPVAMSARVLENRRSSILEMSRNVRAGHFPPKETMTCPRCPAFFICGRLPDGPYAKKTLD
ncbi:MAG: PD-(D/E)XK nuclease family protein, partial [Planctomycetes bacterium]|nr:PD-(D/E)XK nuclease family protein [Planctomycetota bacterium]